MPRFFKIMQGDEYPLNITLLSLDGQAITPNNVTSVEFMVGDIRKTWPETATFDDATLKFKIPLTQKNTFALRKGYINVQARAVFQDGSVVGGESEPGAIMFSRSRSVLPGASDADGEVTARIFIAQQNDVSVPLKRRAGKAATLDGAVLYNQEQDLTSEEREIARNNIRMDDDTLLQCLIDTDTLPAVTSAGAILCAKDKIILM